MGLNKEVKMFGQLIGNRGGIPIVTATQTDAGSDSTNAVYSIPNHTFRFVGQAGLVVINLSAATAATITGLTFNSNSSNQIVTSAQDEAITTTVTAGQHIFLFNKSSNKLQLIV